MLQQRVRDLTHGWCKLDELRHIAGNPTTYALKRAVLGCREVAMSFGQDNPTMRHVIVRTIDFDYWVTSTVLFTYLAYHFLMWSTFRTCLSDNTVLYIDSCCQSSTPSLKLSGRCKQL